MKLESHFLWRCHMFIRRRLIGRVPFKPHSDPYEKGDDSQVHLMLVCDAKQQLNTLTLTILKTNGMDPKLTSLWVKGGTS